MRSDIVKFCLLLAIALSAYVCTDDEHPGRERIAAALILVSCCSATYVV